MTSKVRKAVFPVGGLGARFLPATKAMPKEMLPVVDKPLIQYAFEEARAAGIEEFIFVTGHGKSAIEDHFDHSQGLERVLRERGRDREADEMRSWIPDPGQVAYTRQQEPLGLGHAVWCARHLIGDEPFAVLLADDLVQAATPCLKQMITAYAETGGNLVAAMEVPREAVSRYGVVDPGTRSRSLISVTGLVEKPDPDAAPSNIAVIGRYVLVPEVFEFLDRQERGAGGEIQLTDALAWMIGKAPFHAYLFEGRRFDCGDKAGFIAANVAYALTRDDLRDRIQATLRELGS
jgi:UTP--glucose-1-phosphate uridylyltransferase